jgi:hypothetical protein
MHSIDAYYHTRVHPINISGYISLRLALMVLLSGIRLVLLLMVFSKSMVEIMMRLLLMLLI